MNCKALQQTLNENPLFSFNDTKSVSQEVSVMIRGRIVIMIIVKPFFF